MSPKIRRLWPHDRSQLVAYFQRLDPETRRMRFSGAVSDDFIKAYAEKILRFDAVLFGGFPDGTLRGVGELRGLRASWSRSAEVALLVEPPWQDQGIGDALLNRVLAAAQNRSLKTLHMLCLRENTRMQVLAKKHEARLEFDLGTVEAQLTPPLPTPLSMFEEVFGDTQSYLDVAFGALK